MQKPCAMFAVLLALVTGSGWSQQPAVVQLHHRTAESLVTVLRPLAAPAVLAGAGSQLQIRASPSDLPRVRQLIEQADRPLRPLVVAFSEEPPRAANAESAPRSGSVTLSTGQAMPPDRYGNGQILSTQAGRGPSPVLEGDPLRISMPANQSLWFGVRGSRAGPKAAAAGASAKPSSGPDVAAVAHFDAVSDFTARIWLAEATVAVELQPVTAGTIDAGADRDSDHAVVYGRVGQWIALADSVTDVQAASGAARTGLWIKVDAAPDPVESR